MLTAGTWELRMTIMRSSYEPTNATAGHSRTDQAISQAVGDVRRDTQVSCAESDGADAHMLADMVRTDSHQLRAVAGDSAYPQDDDPGAGPAGAAAAAPAAGVLPRGASALYDDLRARGIEHNDALRRLTNRLVGILHGCLKTRTLYDEATAWSHRQNLPPICRRSLTPKLLGCLCTVPARP
jgi:hypothetical protein